VKDIQKPNMTKLISEKEKKKKTMFQHSEQIYLVLNNEIQCKYETR